jgi:phage terminase large subunit-like protein
VRLSTDPWIDSEAWAACASDRRLQPGERVVLGFDGSYSGDSTALIACSVENDDVSHHLQVLQIWENPGRKDWTVDMDDVEAAIVNATSTYDVVEIAADPRGWERVLQNLLAGGLPAVEAAQSPARMIPATTSFYKMVNGGKLTHDGDPDLARHVANAILKPNDMISKASKGSPRKIDAAVAAVIALDYAMAKEPPRVPMVAFR